MAEFASVVDAVQCAVEIQQVLRAKNALLSEGRRMEFRIGVNLGDVVEEGDNILGDGVNVAARNIPQHGICAAEPESFRQYHNRHNAPPQDPVEIDNLFSEPGYHRAPKVSDLCLNLD